MKNLKKLFLMLGVLLGLFACSSLPTEEDGASTATSSVKFTMQNIANSTNSNILFSSTESETPSKVAISYKKSGEEETTSTTIELTAFGSSYITDDVLSLYEGNYEVTKFDVLNDEGTTIYSTPVSGSDIAINLNITTALAYSFEVKEGEISTEKMQVVAVSDTTDPADFGHAAFTLDLVDFNKFYVEVLVLDETEGWVYTTAQVDVVNAEGTTIKTANIDGKMNKVIVANSDSYKITISKDGYASQELTFSKDDLAKYEKEAMVVKLKKNTNIVTDGLVAYFPLNGNANDESGTGNDGTECGGIDYVDGKIGKCVKFDGAASEYIMCPNSPSLSISKSITLSAWICPSYNSSLTTVITKGYTYDDYALWFDASSLALEFNYAKSYQYLAFANYALNINQWYLLTTSYDYEAGKISYYVNGDLIFEGTYNHLIDTSNEALYLGSDYPGACEYFTGLMDEVRIYNRALSQEEVTALYNEAN